MPGISLEKIQHKMSNALKTDPYPYQVRGVRFVERADGRALIGDDMGLGKSYQAIAWTAIHRDARPVVVVCPATVKYNWQNEWRKHAGLRSHVLDGNILTEREARESLEKTIEKARKNKRPWAARKLIRAAKKRLWRNQQEQTKKIMEAKRHKILIINYDILDSWVPVLLTMNVQVLILDEAHFCKARSSQRTKACHALARDIPHVIALSGTPIAGKPVEFFPILNMLRPTEFPSYWKYCFQFTAPKRNRWSGGWDFSGSSHLDELRAKLKGVMIRRLKRKVLKDLPKKTRTILPVDITNRKEYTEAEAEFLEWLLKRKGKDAWDRASRAEAICKIGALKHLTAEGKLRAAIQWIREWLEGTDQKLIVFTVHKSIMRQLREVFPKALVIDGSVSSKVVRRIDKDGRSYETSKRQEVVDKFQEDSKKRLLFGQLKAAGIGLNLTAASNAVFLELGWSPGEHEQAEDRILRIGTTASKINIYYMVGKKTIEQKIMSIIQVKSGIVDRVLDGKKSGTMQLLSMFMRKAQ